VDHILCRSNAHLQYLHDVEKVPLGKLSYLPEPVDHVFYDGGSTAASDSSALPVHQPYILSAGLEMRDYPTLIKAVTGLPVSLVIAAGSPWSHFRFDAGERPELPPNVHVASFSPTQMRQLYRSAAFVVVPVKPTMRVCGSSVVVEAWAMRKAVIASRTVGLLDYVAEGESGLFAAPYDVDGLRERIVYLLRHPDEADRLGRNGRRNVESTYNLDHFLSRVQAVVRSLAV
jgi:glycosyltransferase involved in cell wall biosynthesis